MARHNPDRRKSFSTQVSAQKPGREPGAPGFLKVCESAVKSNRLFSELLKHKLTFYRMILPSYAAIIHPGGAPEQVIRNWMRALRHEPAAGKQKRAKVEATPVFKLIEEDLARISGEVPGTADDAVVSLMEVPVEEPSFGSWDLY